MPRGSLSRAVAPVVRLALRSGAAKEAEPRVQGLAGMRVLCSAAEAPAIPTTNTLGAAFPNDLRSTSGLGKGDNCETHTSKWLSEGETSPMDLIAEVPPIAVETAVVACRGDAFSLGHPVEFVKVEGRTLDDPATCKYCGLRYYFNRKH